MAIRDSEISAQSMGIHLAQYKTMAFAVSAGFTGLAGALYAHKLRFLSPDQFTVLQSIELLMMMFVGGIGSIHGAFLGAAFIIGLPQAIAAITPWLPAALGGATGLQPTMFGLIADRLHPVRADGPVRPGGSRCASTWSCSRSIGAACSSARSPSRNRIGCDERRCFGSTI